MKPHDKKAALAELSRLYPDARPALHYKSAYELLVAVILSAQCTDERVNKVTEKLFEEHSTPETMCALTQEQLEKYIFSCGLYKTKAEHILSASRDISEHFGGKVPDNIKDPWRSAATPSPWIRTCSASATVWGWQKAGLPRKWRRGFIVRFPNPTGRRRIIG